MATTGKELEAVQVQGLKAALQEYKSQFDSLVTLNSAPTSSTLTYTHNGKTYQFKVGDEVRVPDAENASEGANGYVYYKLYDLVTVGGVTTAYWDLIGSGGGGGGALGKIRVDLTAIVNGSQASSGQLNGVTITLRNTTDDEQVGQPVTWAGQQVVFSKLTPLKAYRISVSSKTGWKRDYEYQDIASLDIAADITKTFEFSALEYTVEMTSNQDVAGTPDADIDRTSTGVYLTARYSYGGSTVSFGSNLHHGDTVKVPSDVDTSTIEIVSSSNVAGYAKQAGVDTVNKKLAVAYSTTIVYASVSSNQSSAVLSGVVCKVDGAAVSTSVGKKVPTGSSFTFATENDLAGYQKVVTNDGTASGTSQIIGVAYNAELVSVALAADTGSPDLSGVTINIYDASDDSVIATGTGSITNQPIASGTSYYVGVSNDVEGYLAPDNTSARTAGSGEDASHTASFEYVATVDGEVTVVPTARELTYTGSSQELVTAGEGTGTMMYKLGDGEWSSVIPSAINAGTYTVKYKAAASHGYYESDEGTVSVTIAKAAQVYTAPQERSLTYSGSSQYLITSGSVTYGTLYYSADGSSWSQTRPSQTNAGTYTSYWKITGDSNHEDVVITSVSTTIQKATPTYTAPSNTGYTYNGSSRYLLTSGSTSHGRIYYSSDGTNWSTTRPSATNAGTYTRYWKLEGDSNHTNISSTSVTCYIYQASASWYSYPSARSVSYTGSNQYLVTSGSATGTVYYSWRYKSYSSSSWGSWSSYSSSRPSQSSPGYYEVRYYCGASSDGNYVASNKPYSTVSVEFYKGSLSLTVSMSGWTYGNTASSPSVSGNSGGGSVTYEYKASTAGDNTYTTTKPSNAGTYTVRATVAETTNYYGGTATNNFTISKASRTISFTTKPTPVKVGNSVTVVATPSAGSGDGSITYSSSNTSIATVSGSTVTGVAYGTAVITATISAGTNYDSAATTYTIKVYTGGVDMGLPSGILWADSNVGASTPYTYECKFFSWGNTDGHEPTSSSSFGSYSWGTANDTEPYVSSAGAALTGNIPLSQDAARANLGSPWRMPTSAEFKELFDNIKYINADGTEVSSSSADKRVTVNGILGLYLESKINGNRLFFACSGYGYGTSWNDRGSYGVYWASTLYSSTYGRSLYFYSSGVYPQDIGYRFYGFAVRAVQ